MFMLHQSAQFLPCCLGCSTEWSRKKYCTKFNAPSLCNRLQ